MEKIKIALFPLVAVGILLAGVGIADAYWFSACTTEGGLSGWWGSFYPTYRLCDESYYTWNTTSLGGEESWMLTAPHYQLCGYSTFDDPGNVSSAAYIPSPDGYQTSYAHYYRWGLSDYLCIGVVDQYNTYGWAYMSTVDWDWDDGFKLSDWTSNESKYSHHVDLDAWAVTCPD